jgi:hypothetical protein
MRKRNVFLVVLLGMCLQTVLAFCQQITVQTEDGKQTVLTRADIEVLPRVKVMTGAAGASAAWEGVSLKALLERGGVGFGETMKGKRLASCLLVEAADEYRVVIALPELDPAFSDKQFVLVFLKDGKPLGDKDGPYRLVIPDEKRMARWVKQVVKLKIADVQYVESVFLNHHFASFNNRGDRVAFFQFEFVSAAAGNGALNEVIADPDDHMRHDVAKLNFFDGSTQFVSR